MSVPIFKSPEIDGVRRSLEYANDGHGDVLSDMYWQLLDDVTSPNLDFRRACRVGSTLINLDYDREYISYCLEEGEEIYDIPDLVECYSSVITQVREILHHGQS